MNFNQLYYGKWHLTGCMLKDKEGIKCQGYSDHIFEFKGDKVALCNSCFKNLHEGRFNRPKGNYDHLYIGRNRIS